MTADKAKRIIERYETKYGKILSNQDDFYILGNKKDGTIRYYQCLEAIIKGEEEEARSKKDLS